MRDSRALLRHRDPLHANDRLARMDAALTEREPPSRFRLLLATLALGLVALGFLLAAVLDQVLIPMTVAVLS